MPAVQSKYAAKPGAKSETSSTSAKNKKVFNLWQKFEPQWCDSCEQDTHTIDRDSTPDDPQYLAWIKMNASADGRTKKPAGAECWSCFYVRRS